MFEGLVWLLVLSEDVLILTVDMLQSSINLCCDSIRTLVGA